MSLKPHFAIRHITFIIGVLMLIFAFYFYGRQHLRYINWTIWGFFGSLISLLMILIRDNPKSKLIWTGIAFVGFLLYYFITPILKEQSFIKLYKKNKVEIEELKALLHSRGDLSILKTDSLSNFGFSDAEQKTLRNIFKSTPVIRIDHLKSGSVYLTTYKMQFSKVGIADNAAKQNPKGNYLQDDWFTFDQNDWVTDSIQNAKSTIFPVVRPE